MLGARFVFRFIEKTAQSAATPAKIGKIRLRHILPKTRSGSPVPVMIPPAGGRAAIPSNECCANCQSPKVFARTLQLSFQKEDLADGDESVGIGKRERPQQNSVD